VTDDDADDGGLLASLDDDELAARYHVALAAAFARGRGVDGDDEATLVRRAVARGLRLHKFKAQSTLPRVRRVLGILRGLQPSTLLDVGSGRGTFLWPLLADPALAGCTILSVDRDARRASDIDAVRRGGIERLSAARMDAARLALADRAVDVVTILEVLEHLPDPARAAREALRVAARHVVVSVPTHEDDNPEHIHLFDPRDLAALLREAGAARVTVEHVLNHTIAVAHRN
jgi:2-polyprenyl-3-methyl-5-hydroxy-6-metoxy-1,4-benzoquinol methylase